MQNENKEFDFPAGIGTVGSTNDPSNNSSEEIKKQLKEIEELMRSEFQDVKQMISGKEYNRVEEALNTASMEDERVNNAVNALEEIEDTPLKVEDGQFTEELNSVIERLNEENNKEEQPIIEKTPEEEKIDVQEDTPFTPVNVDVIDKAEEQQDNILSIEDLEAELNASKEEPDLSEITPIPLEEPVAQSVPTVEPVVTPVTEQVTPSAPAAEPVVTPVTEQVAPSAPAAEAVVTPIAEQVAPSTPTVEPVVTPIAEQVAPSAPAVEPVVTPVVEQVAPSAPAAEAVVTPIAEQVTPSAPAAEAVVTPIAEQVAPSAPAVEPVVTSVAEPNKKIVTNEYVGISLEGNAVKTDGSPQRVNGVQKQLSNKEQVAKTLVNQAA